ncbi:hypothetical protein ABE347_12655 [Bacillus paralicheniformis]|uniref:hypothetical protein n=1 Tax=Bacillus paralicheniformis TaxID=1648923 RepID=UPI003D1CA49A
MNMLIDSAHIPEIERLLDSFPAGGVTTNPALIARKSSPLNSRFKIFGGSFPSICLSMPK